MTPRFFIDRPIFSWVIAIGILLSGIIALRSLPVEQYPTVAPPSLTIGVTYPGADAVPLGAATRTGCPGWTFCSPSTMTRSPGFSPSRIDH